jgi:hypothetical protein
VKKGIVLELDEEFVTLLTPEGEFIQVKKEKDYEIGEEIEARVMKKPIVCRRSFRYVITSLVAAVALLVATLFHFPSSEVYAYMSIDINPSIEVGVNEQLKVLKLKAYNKEGKKIISQLSHWRKKAFVDITEEIIELSMKKGYLQKGGQVLITTVERKHRAASLRELSTELTKIQHLYQQKNIIVKTEESTMEVRNKAVKKGMTTGKLLQIEQKIKSVSPKEKKTEKPLKQIDGENDRRTKNYWLNEKDEKNHEKNKRYEKNKQQMINNPLQKKDQKEENKSNEKKEMQQNHYPSEEEDGEKQKKSNDKEFGEKCKPSIKNSQPHNRHRSYDHHWKHHQRKNNKQDEYHGKQNYDKNSQKAFKHDEHENE